MNNSWQLPSRADRDFLSPLVLEFTTYMETILSAWQETETTVSMATRRVYILREEFGCYEMYLSRPRNQRRAVSCFETH
jgi:hypothetical protein